MESLRACVFSSLRAKIHRLQRNTRLFHVFCVCVVFDVYAYGVRGVCQTMYVWGRSKKRAAVWYKSAEADRIKKNIV